MGAIFAAWVIIVLVGLLFFSLVNLSEYGFAGLFFAILSGYGLFKVFKLIYEGYRSNNNRE